MRGDSESPAAKARRITGAKIPLSFLKDAQVLRRLIDRTRTINEPAKKLFAPKDLRSIKTFRIATISMPIMAADLGPPPRKRRGYDLWVINAPARVEEFRKVFLSELEIAGSSKARFVCFNELGFPTRGRDTATAEFEKRIEEIVARHSIFLIAGSYHDTRECYNIAPIFTPVGEQGSESKRHSHAKLTSATKVREFVRIPSNRQLRYYETAFGNFNILICLDAYDPALTFRLIQKNHPQGGEDAIEMIFVPSFSAEKSKAMAQACEDLSYATASLVVYVNCPENEPKHAVFLCGRRMEDMAPRKEYTVHQIGRHGRLHEIPYDYYHQQRVNVSNGYTALFNFLVGHSAGVRHEIHE
jgi:predicted amidohydrolase